MLAKMVVGAVLVFEPLVLCVACAAKSPYNLSWTIDSGEPEGGQRQLVASGESRELPAVWVDRGRRVRVFQEAPSAAHDTIGFLYWRHTETPLKVKEKDTDCETLSGIVSSTTVCSGKAYSVTARCADDCWRNTVRGVADSLGADAIITISERATFEGSSGTPRAIPVSNAGSQGFQGSYVLIKWIP
ncbi:MAG: hypothetical protein ACE5HT_16330 [Gemmatimonadales bacterium]